MCSLYFESGHSDSERNMQVMVHSGTQGKIQHALSHVSHVYKWLVLQELSPSFPIYTRLLLIQADYRKSHYRRLAIHDVPLQSFACYVISPCPFEDPDRAPLKEVLGGQYNYREGGRQVLRQGAKGRRRNRKWQ